MGAMFVAGVFKGTVDFDPGTKEEKVTALAGGDVYVTRSAADGTYQWTRTVPSTGDEPWAVAMPAADGGVFVAGYFSGTADFFPGQPGAKKTTPMSEGYVLKLMADGSFGFLRTFPGFYNSVVYEGAGLRDGGVVVAGAFSGSVDFGMGPREMGAGGGFLVKLSSTGTTSWGRTFPAKDLPMGGISAPGAAAEAADGSIFTAGTFAGTLDLDPGTGTVETMAGAGQSLFVVKLNAAGQYLDGTAVAVGAKEMYVKDLATAPDGSLYAAGSFLGSSFPLGPGGAQARSSAGSHDAFVASFTPTGEFRWAHSFGGTDYDYVIGLVSPPDGGVIATGAFRSPMIDLGSASRPDRRDPATGSLFVSKLAADGSYGGAFTIGPKLTATPSLLRPTKDGFLLGGIYASPVDFNPRAPDKDERTPIGQAVFVSRYAY